MTPDDETNLIRTEDTSLMRFETAEYALSRRLHRRAIGAFAGIGLVILLLAILSGNILFGGFGTGAAFAAALFSLQNLRQKERMIEELRRTGVRVAGRVDSLNTWSGQVSIRYEFDTHDGESIEGVAMLNARVTSIRELVPVVAYDPDKPRERHAVVGWRPPATSPSSAQE